VTEALDLAVAKVSEDTDEALAHAKTLPEAIAAIVAPSSTPATTTSSAPTSASYSPIGRGRSPTST
jgi:hypothetical protein